MTVRSATSEEEAPDSRDGGVAGRRVAESNAATGPRLVLRHKVIKKVTEDIHRHSFNTAVATLMEYVNDLYKLGSTTDDLIVLAKLLKPFAPHLASEMLEHLDSDDTWPTWDESLLVEETVEVVVQVNGKVRAKLSLPADRVADEDFVKSEALKDTNVQKFIKTEPRKVIYIQKNHLLSLVA